jgi:hypothetical protein
MLAAFHVAPKKNRGSIVKGYKILCNTAKALKIQTWRTIKKHSLGRVDSYSDEKVCAQRKDDPISS